MNGKVVGYFVYSEKAGTLCIHAHFSHKENAEIWIDEQEPSVRANLQITEAPGLLSMLQPAFTSDRLRPHMFLE